MKIYDWYENGVLKSSIPETLIDEGFKNQGIADGFIVERDMSHDEELTEIRRLRALEYPSIGDQLDALYKARQGDSSEIQAIDLQIAATKLKYPKPSIT